ncbi:unnamed protein product [Urochloa decumbens]|uniref:Uncharacterized protein n=1 Tax=Urochloa decumbens TaxID=240449 RepID=A0ABC8YXX6_9POAL
MAAKVDEDKKLAASLLPVTVAEEEEAAVAILLVSLWALLFAGIVLGCAACDYALSHYHILILPPSWMTGGPKLTGAEAAVERALRHGVAWSSAAAAAAAGLAMLLPGRHRRSRRALAYVALTATAATHLMFAKAVTLLLTADPGAIFFWVFGLIGTVDILIMAAGDIICLLLLALL